jgi:uncharacterized membrane protein YbhN (UPF0104 family)
MWLLSLSTIIWFLWIAVVYFGIKAFHLELPMTAALLAGVMIPLGLMIPSSPGFIGVFQYMTIVALSTFAVPKEVALSVSIVVHAVSYIPTTLLGWFYATRMGLSLGTDLIRENTEEAEVEK